jgi:hypothetical protein
MGFNITLNPTKFTQSETPVCSSLMAMEFAINIFALTKINEEKYGRRPSL